MIYFELFLGFLKVGLFSFGGAYGAIPLIREVVLSYGWLDDEMITYIIAVSESTPGPIMVNLATYVGNVLGGLPGAILATVTVVLPAFVIILLVMVLLGSLLKSPYVQAAFDGLKSAVAGIILATGTYMILHSCIGMLPDPAPDLTAVLMTVVLAGIYFGSRKVLKKRLSPIALIAISAASGVLVYGFT